MSFHQAAANYKKNAILTAPPEKLVILLYEGAIQHMEKARHILRSDGDRYSPVIGEAMGKALAIVGELRSSLDMGNGGDIAKNLESLYEFITDCIMQANIDRQPETLENALVVMRTLKEGWDGLLTKGA